MVTAKCTSHTTRRQRRRIQCLQGCEQSRQPSLPSRRQRWRWRAVDCQRSFGAVTISGGFGSRSSLGSLPRGHLHQRRRQHCGGMSACTAASARPLPLQGAPTASPSCLGPMHRPIHVCVDAGGGVSGVGHDQVTANGRCHLQQRGDEKSPPSMLCAAAPTLPSSCFCRCDGVRRRRCQ